MKQSNWIDRGDSTFADIQTLYNEGRMDFRGANLEGAYLRGAYLEGAKGISAIYVPGMSTRGDYLYAVRHKDALMIKAGCWWGTVDEFETRVKSERGEGHPYLLAIVFLRSVMKG